jgi:hypothetical protein
MFPCPPNDEGGIHGWGTTFGTKDLRTIYVVVDLGVYHDLLLFDQ